jgi:colanic acid/amylovoran biosynthesis glycosyltransferase
LHARAEKMNNHLRVLEAFYSYLAGTENWIYRIIKHLPDTDVVIASRNFIKCSFYASNFEYLEFPLRRIETGPRTLPVRIFNALAFKTAQNPYFAYVAKYAGQIDLIHSHFAVTGWEYLDLAKKIEKPHVVSFYGFDYENLPFTDPTWKKRYKQLFAEADLFLCEGSFGAKALQQTGCPQSKIKVQRLGVEVDSIPFFQREKEPGELKLLQIATLTGKKGHLYTMKAFVKALETCPNMSLTFVGKDVEGIKREIQELANQRRVQDKVAFFDWIDFDSLHSFMKDFHVFIQPSCYTKTRDCEGGAPIVLLDAQATGMPVIATTHCDIPDEVIHRETGLLTPEKDVESLVRSIKYFYELDDDAYWVFCENARKHISRNFDCKQNAAQLKKTYDLCIEKKHVAP